MAGPSIGSGIFSGMTKKERKGQNNFLIISATLVWILILGGSIYRYYNGKNVTSSMFIEPLIFIIINIFVLYFVNRKSNRNKYKKNGIRVMGKIEEFEKYSINYTKNTHSASKQFTDYDNYSGYGRHAYRVYVRVINPHTGKGMVCTSLGYMHPIDGYNLKEIPVYFHKRNSKKYYVDVMEAIENNQ